MSRQSRARETKTDVRLQLWVPAEMREALDAAAEASWEKRAELLKRYCREGLERDRERRAAAGPRRRG